MKSPRLLLAAMTLAGGLGGCSDPAATRAAEAARLLEADRALAQASLEQGTAQAFFDRATEDAVQLPANAAPTTGRGAIRDRLAPLGMNVLDRTPRRGEVAASLDLGWTWGEWRLLASAQSREVLAHGKYLDVWRREPGGAWKLAADLGNEAAPPADPEEQPAGPDSTPPVPAAPPPG